MGRCIGTVVVHDDGSVAFCTAGCHPGGVAEALVGHNRHVPGKWVVEVFRCLLEPGPPPRLRPAVV